MSKREQLVSLLRCGWVSAASLQEKFGWQNHTLRGAISRIGDEVERKREDGITSYRVKPAAPPPEVIADPAAGTDPLEIPDYLRRTQ